MAFPTNPIYKLLKDEITGKDYGVLKMEGTTLMSIPFVEDNTDYQKYLEWVGEGNTAEAAG